MNTIKPSAASEEAKNDFINSVIKKAKEPGVNSMENIIIVRGERSMLIHGDVLGVVEDYDNVAHLTRMIKASEECKDSYHQIDFIIFTKVSSFRKEEMHSKDIPVEYKNMNGMKALYDQVYEKNKDSIDNNKNLIFFIMSRESLEMHTYDIVESTDGERVMAPEPIITTCLNNTAPGDERGTLIVLAGKPLPNLFDNEIATIFNTHVAVNQKEIDDSFKNDYILFKSKSDFIKERDEKVSSNQE